MVLLDPQVKNLQTEGKSWEWGCVGIRDEWFDEVVKSTVEHKLFLIGNVRQFNLSIKCSEEIKYPVV